VSQRRVLFALAALALAVGRRDGLSLDRLLAAALHQARSPRRLVPAPEGVAPPPGWISQATAAHFDGWYAPINRTWFSGSYDQPAINNTPFYWYVFAIPARRRYRADHYALCDYLQVREWVLAFAAPLGNDHRDHKHWRCDLRLYPDERTGYFRWGDEPPGRDDQPGRVFEIDNLMTAERLRNRRATRQHTANVRRLLTAVERPARLRAARYRPAATPVRGTGRCDTLDLHAQQGCDVPSVGGRAGWLRRYGLAR
jgi:hypothetical protein